MPGLNLAPSRRRMTIRQIDRLAPERKKAAQPSFPKEKSSPEQSAYVGWEKYVAKQRVAVTEMGGHGAPEIAG